jgi:carbonic anhydrase/acetyltransferase-like protein (isoleucine patch superfamily)
VSRTALPMAERQTSPSASARTSRVHSLRSAGRQQDAVAVADLLREGAAAGAGLAGAAASLVDAPLGVGGLPGREALGELVQLLAAHAGEDRGGQGVDDRGPGGAEVLVEEGEQVVGGGEPHRCDSRVVGVVFEGFAGLVHEVDPGAFVAPTAVLVGDVTVAAGASVWYGAVLRADFGPIVVGAGSNVQDNCVLHAAEGLPTVLEDEVTVGHLATMESWVIERGALIGMGAVVLQRARVGRGSVVAAGSVVAEDAQIPPDVLAAGIPAQGKRELSGKAEQ